MKASTLTLVLFSNGVLLLLSSLFALGAFKGYTLVDEGLILKESFLLPRSALSQSALQSPINDKTLSWNASLRRLWFQPGPKPPAVVTLTSLYWNHPNQTFGLTHFRTKRSRQIMNGVLNHPWFQPSAWEEIVNGRWKNDSTRIYAFFDYETCAEKSFPMYGRGLAENADGIGNRTTDWKSFHPQNPFRALVNMTLMWHYPQMKVIILDCGGEGPRWFSVSRNNNPHQQISLASISASPRHHFAQDQGFPPPVVTDCNLNATLRNNIANCREDTRRYLLTFVGNFRSQVRKQLRDFVHNDRDILFGSSKMMDKMGMDFQELVRLSKFGACPRGDNLFSYRFVEVMSGGAIPVLYADDLVLPFENIINWHEIAVLIPENQTNQTREILMAISDKQRCQMRQKMFQVYQRYISTGEGVVAGIVDGLEAKFRSNMWMNSVK